MRVIVTTQDVEWVFVDPSDIHETETFPVGEIHIVKKVPTPSNPPCSPWYELLLCKILHDVEIDSLTLPNYPDIYDWCTRQRTPHLGQDSLGYVVGSHYQVVMRPALLCDFEDSEVLEFIDDPSKLSGELSYHTSGTLISRTWADPLVVGDSQSNQTIRLGVFTTPSKSGYLSFATIPAAPPLTPYLDNTPFAKELAEARKSLSGWTSLMSPTTSFHRRNEESYRQILTSFFPNGSICD